MADAITRNWIQHWDCYPSPHPWWVTAYVISIVVIICNATLLAVNFRQLFIKKDELDSFIQRKANKLFYLLIVSFYTIGPSVYFLTDSLQMGCSLNVYWFLFLKAMGLQIMTFATEMLYLFYVLRITKVFEPVPDLKFAKYQIYFFYFGFAAQIICQCISYWYYLNVFKDMSNTKYQELALQWSYGALSFYVLFAVMLLVTFSYKVYKLLHYHDSEKLDKEIEKSQPRRAAIFAVHYLWLAAIALFTTIILDIVSVFRSKAGLKMSIIMIKNMFLTVDTVVNVICLYLQFTFAEPWYWKMCGCCHERWMKVSGLKNKAVSMGKVMTMSDKTSTNSSTTAAVTSTNATPVTVPTLNKSITPIDDGTANSRVYYQVHQ